MKKSTLLAVVLLWIFLYVYLLLASQKFDSSRALIETSTNPRHTYSDNAYRDSVGRIIFEYPPGWKLDTGYRLLSEDDPRIVKIVTLTGPHGLVLTYYPDLPDEECLERIYTSDLELSNAVWSNCYDNVWTVQTGPSDLSKASIGMYTKRADVGEDDMYNTFRNFNPGFVHNGKICAFYGSTDDSSTVIFDVNDAQGILVWAKLY